MNLLSRIRNRLTKPKGGRVRKDDRGPLREFVYLDEVSLYSMLASRKRGIATEFTEMETASLNAEIGSSAGVAFGASASVESRVQSEQQRSSQVLRKAIIQSSFRELYQSEQETLALRLLEDQQIPSLGTGADIEGALDSLLQGSWVIDPEEIRRGELIEVEVELEADPIFHMAVIITTVSDLMEEGDDLFDRGTVGGLDKMRAMARVLESLLGRLAPIRGRLLDYEAVVVGDRELLVHRSVLDQFPTDQKLKRSPVFVVGVTQTELFWQDIRRVLFSRAQYTAFCRLTMAGLTDTWRPVTGADVLAGIAPGLDQQIQEFSESACHAMRTGAQEAVKRSSAQGMQNRQVIEGYADFLCREHGHDLTPEVSDKILGIPLNGDWLHTVDGRREVLSQVVDVLNAEFGVETSSEAAYGAREAALKLAGLSLTGEPLSDEPNVTARDFPSPPRPERFFNAEITAIYW